MRWCGVVRNTQLGTDNQCECECEYILKFNSIPHDQVLSEWFLVAFPWHIVSLTVQVIALTLKHLVRPFCKPSVKRSSYQMSKHVALNKGELWNHTAIKLSGDTRSSSCAMNDIFWIILWAISHSQQSHINISFKVIISLHFYILLSKTLGRDFLVGLDETFLQLLTTSLLAVNLHQL
jgi:hypothetical protein